MKELKYSKTSFITKKIILKYAEKLEIGVVISSLRICNYRGRVDSRARECENPAYFVILTHNCDLGAPTIPQITEKWCIFVSLVRIVVLFL